MALTERKNRKTRTGFVFSSKMDKSVVVMVERQVVHPRYGKIIRRRKKYIAHDEANACSPGDKVRIVETRPLSKSKRWRLVDILEKAK